MRGRKPKPTALKVIEGNPGKRRVPGDAAAPPGGRPTCPAHLSAAARAEWRRVAPILARLGVLGSTDRAALAAYCQVWGRWVEAEKELRRTPTLLRTPSGYVQPSPWLAIANRQLELMARYMAELGLTPSARARIATGPAGAPPPWSQDPGDEDDDLLRG